MLAAPPERDIRARGWRRWSRRLKAWASQAAGLGVGGLRGLQFGVQAVRGAQAFRWASGAAGRRLLWRSTGAAFGVPQASDAAPLVGVGFGLGCDAELPRRTTKGSASQRASRVVVGLLASDGGSPKISLFCSFKFAFIYFCLFRFSSICVSLAILG